MNIYQAIEQLKQGEVLTDGRSLFAYRQGIFLVSGLNFTTRMKYETFLDLYHEAAFLPHAAQSAADESADMEYYGRLQARQ